jgi:hypothetical protein
MQDVNFESTKLVSTELTQVDMSGAVFGFSVFADLDLREVNGLKNTQHIGPSSISTDTFYRSRGKIPRSFLEACGMETSFIDYMFSLIQQSVIEFYSCFISHSTADQEFCDQLYQRLRSNHVRVWYAPKHMRGGRKLFNQIDTAIRHHDKLILVLSEESITSEWVELEIQRALRKEQRLQKEEPEARVLFPIRLMSFDQLEDWTLVNSQGIDLAEEVRQYYIPDFSNWKNHDDFVSAFDRLLDDLDSNTEI